MLLLRAVTAALIKDKRILYSFLIIILDHYTERFPVRVTLQKFKLIKWQLADCNRHIDYNHQGTKTEIFGPFEVLSISVQIKK